MNIYCLQCEYSYAIKRSYVCNVIVQTKTKYNKPSKAKV